MPGGGLRPVHMNSCCANGYGFQYPGMFELRTNIAGSM